MSQETTAEEVTSVKILGKNTHANNQPGGCVEGIEQDILPLAVNWHFWPRCNYGCNFCFARFEEIATANKMSKADALTVPQMLADAGADKLTFVGGEPTLCKYLDELLDAAKNAGLTTCIVSNGTGLTEAFLSKNHQNIDWIGISIDASNDDLHYKIGRGQSKDLRKGFSNHLVDTLPVWDLCKKYGIKMKLNTVVSSVNMDDDMNQLVEILMPERWKIFQVLPVEGQNDGDVDPLLINEYQFEKWVKRHSQVESLGIQFVPESNDLMRGSYAMLDAKGRFYSNVNGGHQYGPSILDVSVEDAWSQNVFLEEKFSERGGEYDWKDNGKRLPMAN